MAKRAAYPSGLALLLLASAVVSSASGDGIICNTRGFFSKPGACHEHYICMDGRGEPATLTMCNPTHHIFVEDTQKCEPETPHNRILCNQHSLHQEIDPVIEEERVGVSTLSTAAPVNAEEPTLSIDQDTVAGAGSEGYEQHPRATGGIVDDSDAAQLVVISRPSTADDNDEEYVDLHSQEDQPPIPEGARQNGGEYVDPDETYNTTSRPAEKELTLCDHENIIDTYVSLVIGSPSLRESLPYQEQYNGLIEEYNRKMMQAKSNTQTWRQGESIVMGLKRVHMKAAEFQHEFPRKFDVYKKQIRILSTPKMNPLHIQRLQEDITRLRENLRLTKDTLKLTDNSAMKTYLEANIETAEREIKRKEKEINKSPEENKLKAMKVFLSLVSDDAGVVKDLAKEVLDQTKGFIENVRNDTKVYKKLLDNNKEANERLDGKSKDTRNKLENVTQQQEQLETQKEELEVRLKDLEANKTTIIEELKLVREEKERKQTEYRDSRMKLCTNSTNITYSVKSTLNPYDSPDCDKLMKSRNITLDVKEEIEKEEELLRTKDMINANFSTTEEEKQSIYPKLKDLFGVAPSLEERLDQMKFERYNIQRNAGQLQELKTQGGVAKKSIREVKDQILALQKHYKNIVEKLQTMTNDTNVLSRDKERTEIGDTLDKQRMDVESTLGEQRNDIENGLAKQRIDIENGLEVLQIGVEDHKFENINNCRYMLF